MSNYSREIFHHILITTKLEGYRDQYHTFLLSFKSQKSCEDKLRELELERIKNKLKNRTFRYLTSTIIEENSNHDNAEQN